MNGTSTLTEETQRSPSPILPCEKMVIYELGKGSSPDTNSASTLILDFPVSGNVRNKFMLFICHLVHGVFIVEA